MSVTILSFTNKEFIFHGDEQFEFLNDTGVTIPAGATVIITDGASNNEMGVIHHQVEDGRIGSVTLTKPRRIYLCPYAGGSNVAVGEILSVDVVTGNLIKGTTGAGRFVGLPKHGKTMTGASAAAATTDTAILAMEL